VFRGTYEHAIDGKGRTSFPSKFRELLSAEGSPKLVLTTGLEPCVVAYTVRDWNAFEERVKGMPRFDKAVRDLMLYYVTPAQDVEVDGVGRLLIPPMLRDHAKLTREAVWAGTGQCAELWDKETFFAAREALKKDENRVENMTRRLAELGL
jgi:MraZ protein